MTFVYIQADFNGNSNLFNDCFVLLCMGWNYAYSIETCKITYDYEKNYKYQQNHNYTLSRTDSRLDLTKNT